MRSLPRNINHPAVHNDRRYKSLLARGLPLIVQFLHSIGFLRLNRARGSADQTDHACPRKKGSQPRRKSPASREIVVHSSSSSFEVLKMPIEILEQSKTKNIASRGNCHALR